jgi:hypothetical protein
LAIVACVSGALLWSIWRYRPGGAALVVIILGLLVPGRVLGYFCSDLLAGLRLLRERRLEILLVCRAVGAESG